MIRCLKRKRKRRLGIVNFTVEEADGGGGRWLMRAENAGCDECQSTCFMGVKGLAQQQWSRLLISSGRARISRGRIP